MKFDLSFVTPAMTATLKRAGSNDESVALAAQREIAKAFTEPLKKGVLNVDNQNGIFTPIKFEPGQSVEFPLDFLTPGTERDFVAYTIPNTGRLPERNVEGDYIMVRTYDVGATIDCPLKYLRDARWDVMGKMMAVLEAMFTLKRNNDAWHTLMAAGAGRGIKVVDSKASQGQFTKRLVAQMENTMAREAGGNVGSLGRGRLTDLWISLEAHSSILSWDLTQIPDALRMAIYTNWENGGLTKIGRVTLHDMTELGVSQDYEDYLEVTLACTIPSNKEEFCVGLDLQNKDSFVNPIRQEVEVFEDTSFHRQRRAGVYGFGEHGFAVLDSRRVILGAI